MADRYPTRIGEKFNFLTVLAEAPRRPDHPNKRKRVTAKCDCGVIKDFTLSELTHGKTKSCGCYGALLRKQAGTRTYKHGHSRTANGHSSKTYYSWRSMIARCTNPNAPKWARYGGRGITVCERWRDSFGNFLADLGERPDGTTLERNDLNGNYEPGNCRWATSVEQLNNTSRNPTLEFNGEHLTPRQWSIKTGIPQKVITDRMSRGWSVERAVTQPPRKCRTKHK